MKKLYSLLTALLIIYSVQAQEVVPRWAQTVGGSDNDFGAGVAVDHKGGVYVIGNFKSPSITLGSTTLTNQGNWDFFLAKYDTSGALIWVQQFGNDGKDSASRVMVSSDGSIYVAAVKDTLVWNSTGTFSSIHSRGQLMKFNPAGSLLWRNSDIPIQQLDIDKRGNIYATPTGSMSYSKYSPDGVFLFEREIFLYSYSNLFTPVMSANPDGQVHIVFHAPSNTTVTTNPANNVLPTMSGVSRIVYDSLGGIIEGKSLSPLRELYRYYKAKNINEYAFTYVYNYGASPAYGWYTRGMGAVGERTNCPIAYYPTSRSIDFHSDAAYFGENYISNTCHSNTFLPQSTGTDMLFIGTRSLPNYQGEDAIYSTTINGNTDETNVTIAIDTVGKYLYAVGGWSKREDTSHFRFGSSDLVNAGATGTSDLLFLKFKLAPTSLKADAGTDKSICTTISTTLHGSAGGGTGPYTYSWSPAAGLNNATILRPQADPDTTTSYVLTVTDADGSIARDTVLVKVNPDLFRPTISLSSGTNPFCQGNSVTLTAFGGTNYVWSNGETSFATVVRKSDTLTVTGTGPQGCVGTSQPYIVVMTPAPATPGISPATGYILDVCQGSTTTLTATHPDPTARFTWSTGATTPSINVTTPGVYSVRARVDGNSCISALGQVNVQTNLPATATLSAGGNTTFCEGDSVRLTVSTATGNTILWSNGATTPSIWVKTSGTYSAQVSSPGCPATSTHSISVTVKPKPARPTISASGSTTFCAGGSVTLTASTNISGASWLWSNGATTQSIIVNGSGTYSVTATADGCSSSTSAGTTVTVNPSPDANISASGTTTFCEGASVRLDANTQSLNTVLWSNGATTRSITVDTSGTFSAQITTPAGCTMTTNSIPVTVKPNPAIPIITASGSTTFCAGESVTLTASSSTPGVTWRWSNGGRTESITVSASGSFNVVADAPNNCASRSIGNTIVTVNPLPTGSISASGSTTFCEGGSVQLNVSTASGNSILWSTGATTPYITVNTSGTYSAQITSPSGCTITTNSITVTAKPKPATPVISASGSTSFCSGGNVTLTASTSTSGVNWQWSNGATTPSITVNASGTYTATASIDGCNSTSAGTTVTVNPAPTGSISASGNTVFCEGGNVQLSVSTASGNSILWSNGATTSSITVNTSGTYSAQITSPAGCTISTNAITVTVNPKPATPTVSTSGSTTLCSGGSVTLIASSGTSGVNWQWSNGATTSSISVNASGTYTATASINGCSSTSSGTLVTVNPAPTGSISAIGSTSFCEGDSVQLTVSTASGNNILWSNGATSSSIWVKTGGTYSVQLTSAQGCTATTNSISTTVLQRPSPVIGQSGNELSVSPAASAYQWYLNGTAISGATGQTLTISQGGDYSVVVTGSNGCKATAYHSAVFRVNTSFIDYQAYPNPVTADLRLAYTLKEGGQVTFTIVDDQGRQKMVIPVGHQSPGDHQYTIRNAAMRLGTGFYLLKISVGDKQVVHRIVVL